MHLHKQQMHFVWYHQLFVHHETVLESTKAVGKIGPLASIYPTTGWQCSHPLCLCICQLRAGNLFLYSRATEKWLNIKTYYSSWWLGLWQLVTSCIVPECWQKQECCFSQRDSFYGYLDRLITKLWEGQGFGRWIITTLPVLEEPQRFSWNKGESI